MTKITLDQSKVAEMFRFLDQLREDGSINMFGAARPLEQVYGDRDQSRAVHAAWMTSDGKTDAEDRARKVLADQDA